MRTATDRLTGALVSMAAAGERPPCGAFGAAELWVSDDPGDRSIAAYWCEGCPVFDYCEAAADENNERFGVWAGRDRTPDRSVHAMRGDRDADPHRTG